MLAAARGRSTAEAPERRAGLRRPPGGTPGGSSALPRPGRPPSPPAAGSRRQPRVPRAAAAESYGSFVTFSDLNGHFPGARVARGRRVPPAARPAAGTATASAACAPGREGARQRGRCLPPPARLSRRVSTPLGARATACTARQGQVPREAARERAAKGTAEPRPGALAASPPELHGAALPPPRPGPRSHAGRRYGGRRRGPAAREESAPGGAPAPSPGPPRSCRSPARRAGLPKWPAPPHPAGAARRPSAPAASCGPPPRGAWPLPPAPCSAAAPALAPAPGVMPCPATTAAGRRAAPRGSG